MQTLKTLLDLHIKLLVLEHGRNRVLQSLANVVDVTEAALCSEIDAYSKAKKQTRVDLPATELLANLKLSPAKYELLNALIKEFLNKRFLGELRLVAKFLREHGISKAPKSRVAGLPKVISFLAQESEASLQSRVDDCAKSSEQSGFAQLAGAIMYQPPREAEKNNASSEADERA